MRRLLLTGALLSLLGCVHPGPLPVVTPPRKAQVKKDYYRTLPAGRYALRKVYDPLLLPNLAKGLTDRARLVGAVERSLSYLNKPSSKPFFPVSGISHEQVRRSLEVFRDLLRSDRDEVELAGELRRRFDAYISVGCDDRGTVLFTGYYTPIFAASKTRTARFRYPLHRPPVNHIKDVRTGKTIGLRREDGTIDPEYPDRKALVGSELLEGRELVWMSDPFEAYVVGVQGSAILRLPDGSKLEVGYAGTNGHPYDSLGLALVRAGKLRKDQLSLRKMIEYFRKHPADFPKLSANNKRYVFFQEAAGGPFGSLNEKVTPLRSIATDKSIFPRGALCFIEAPLPVTDVDARGMFHGFVLDQDTGGAIRAPGRCDVYMGIGEAAGQVAGRTLAEGRMYYLILKDEELFSLR